MDETTPYDRLWESREKTARWTTRVVVVALALLAVALAGAVTGWMAVSWLAAPSVPALLGSFVVAFMAVQWNSDDESMLTVALESAVADQLRAAGESASYDLYVSECRRAWREEGHARSRYDMLRLRAALTVDELNELLEGLETDRRERAMEALLTVALPVWAVHGSSQRARRSLIAPLDRAPAHEIIRAALEPAVS